MRVLLSTGEPSGDLLAKLLCEELAAGTADVAVVRLQDHVPARPVVGFARGLWNSTRLSHAIHRAEICTLASRPDIAVLVSYSGFHLPLGARLRRLGVPVLLVGPPQLWAWGRWRVHWLREAADRVVCLFAFEESLLRRAGVKADYFGHPLLDGVRAERPRPEVLAALGLATADRYVVLLPGSRPAEVAHHRPLFASVAAGLTAARPGLSCAMAEYDPKLPVSRFDIMAQAECAIAVSGTVTAELAILGVPMVVTYHMPAVELLLARLLVKLRWFSLPNILTGREVVPECLNASAADLVGRTLELLQDGPARRTMSAGLADVRTRLLPAGAMARIARLVAQMARSDMTQAA